jgi:hypothetical protein
VRENPQNGDLGIDQTWEWIQLPYRLYILESKYELKSANLLSWELSFEMMEPWAPCIYAWHVWGHCVVVLAVILIQCQLMSYLEIS